MSKLKRNIIQFTYDIEEFIAEIKEVNFYVKGNNKENILKVREKYIYIFIILS